VNPEKGVLATLVRALRDKEAEACGTVSVLYDILRDIGRPLPPTSAPTVEVDAGESGKARRLEAMVAEPKRSLGRLIDAADVLAEIAGPLAPSLTQAIDQLTLICVREVDRLAARCHADYETLLQAYLDAAK
ncbi:unnamed protein product, partial [Polarella glacialis]